MKYTHLFQTDQQLEAAYNGSDYIEPWLALSKESETVTYNKTEEQKLLGTPLTFEIVSGGNITWMASNSSHTATIEYKKNDGEWTEITSAPEVKGDITGLTTTDFGLFIYSGYDGSYYIWTGTSGALYSYERNDVLGRNLYAEVISTTNGGSAITTTLGSFNYSHEDSDDWSGEIYYYWTGVNGTVMTNWVAPDEITIGSKDQVYIDNFGVQYEITPPPSITVASGDTVRFRGNNAAYAGGTISTYGASWYNCFSGSTARFNVNGNIMSLIDSTGFTTAVLQTSATFYKLFQGTNPINTNNLVLPAATLTHSCYKYMFAGCTSLTTAPELPATTLASNCYEYMFSGCTSLTTAPVLPATTLIDYCYSRMFLGCTSLVTAPALPATTLANNCYYYMFNGCTSLTTAPAILPATTLVVSCYTAMFMDCTSLTSAPELPAITLVNYSYYQMFQGCTSLNYIKALFTTKPSNNYTFNWVSGVAASGTFVKNVEAIWNETGVNGIPVGWLVSPAEGVAAYSYLIALPESGGSGQITAYAGSNWTASTPDSWISLGLSTGTTGDTPITITASNTQGPRIGSVVLQSATNQKTIQVIQNNKYVTPLTFEILSAGTISWYTTDSSSPEKKRTIEYSLDNGLTWTSITSDNGPSRPIINVNAGDSVQFRGNNMTYRGNNGYHRNSFSGTTAGFKAKGNIMSLIDSTGFTALDTFVSAYTFGVLFEDCPNLTDASELILPATTLADYCYQYMFRGCTSLTTAPELPATTLAESCYQYMFGGCTSLTTAPELPATALTYACYSTMFQGCTSLTTAPAILPATTLTNYCYSGMFSGCTSLTTAPELPAITLVTSCYNSMFAGCTSLNHIKAMFTTTPGYSYTSSWVSGVASSGTFVKNSAAAWNVSGNNGIPNNWTVQIAS